MKKQSKKTKTAELDNKDKPQLQWESLVNKAIAELSDALISPAFSIEQIANIVLEQTKLVTKSAHGYVSSIDPETEDMISHTLTNMFRGACRVKPPYKKIVFPKGPDGKYPGLWGHSLNTRKAFFTNDPAHHKASKGVPKGHIPIKNFLTVPAMVADEVLGQISLANTEKKYTKKHLDAVGRIAQLYALALRRIRYEQDLQTSEARYHGIVQDQTELICRFLPDCILTFVNEAFCRYFDGTYEKLIGKNFKTFFPKQDRQKLEKLLKSFKRKNPVATYEHCVIQKNAQFRWQRWTYRALFDEKRKMTEIQAVGWDVTEHKLADEKILRQSEFLENILKSITNPLYVIDANDFTVKLSNTAAYQWKSSKQTTCYALIHNLKEPCNTKEHPCPLEIIKKTKKPVTIEHARRDKQGRLRNVEINAFPILDNKGNVEEIIEYCVNMTEHRKAEQALKRSEERYTLAQRAANIGSWDWDIISDRLVWSERIEPMFGFAKGQFGETYEAFLDCVHPDDRQFVIDSVNACINEGKDYAIEHRTVWPDGTIRWVSETGDVIRDKNGKAIRMLGIVQDITEKKQDQEEITNLAKFPSENPYPVLRIANDGIVLYANAAGTELINQWGCQIGSVAPEGWCQYVFSVHKSGESRELEIKSDGRVFSLILASIVEGEYVNVYGMDVTERKQAEEDLRKYRRHLEELVDERTKELLDANIRLQQQIDERKRLENELLEISEREQRKIGRELHDSLGQQLTGVAILAKVLEQKLKTNSASEASDARKISELVNQAVNQTRSLSKGLYPLSLDSSGLMLALQELTNATKSIFGISCTFRCREPVLVADIATALNLYRIAQEAVNNAIKHGNSKNITIELSRKNDESLLTVQSDGLDFPEQTDSDQGMGLRIMKYRAEMIGGTFDISKAPAGGTIAVCSFGKNVENAEK